MQTRIEKATFFCYTFYVSYRVRKRGEKMGLLDEWRDEAYYQKDNERKNKKLWEHYFEVEKGIYEQLLKDPDTVVTGTVEELANKYNTELKIMVGFLDGINESLKTENPIHEMDKDTRVSLDIDIEKLYYHMVEAKADWLYNLEAWDKLLTPERRKELYKEQKSSGTVVKGKKTGRNDPCPCGSGKKYKFCCGRA
jgi:preprotein translocase subunit SecA